ncbi:Os07g0115780 [Oryza sativa Japonica Group]|uniref:Os07g0115780 protein n=1 Tax=Oryza sativa subsp. japonica TaxID=39947 RepID=A0A0P0X1U5_ORYSJ|nr:hypothetical protein DAI22_07g012100 [Oryza sativa Japonica Group]BAS99807.1 Os07g0115780 [Oryza sativa Japonica Group]
MSCGERSTTQSDSSSERIGDALKQRGGGEGARAATGEPTGVEACEAEGVASEGDAARRGRTRRPPCRSDGELGLRGRLQSRARWLRPKQRRQRTGRRQVAIWCADDKQLRHRSYSSGGIPVRVSVEEGLTEAPGRRCRGQRRRRRRPGFQSPSCAGCRAATGGGTAAAAAGAAGAAGGGVGAAPKTPLKMEAGGGALARRRGALERWRVGDEGGRAAEAPHSEACEAEGDAEGGRAAGAPHRPAEGGAGRPDGAAGEAGRPAVTTTTAGEAGRVRGGRRATSR